MLLCSDHAGIRQHAGELIELTDANRLPSEARALANGFLGWVQTALKTRRNTCRHMHRVPGNGHQKIWTVIPGRGPITTALCLICLVQIRRLLGVAFGHPDSHHQLDFIPSIRRFRILDANIGPNRCHQYLTAS